MSTAAAARKKQPSRRRRQQRYNPVTLGVLCVVFLLLITYFGFTKRIPFTGRWTLKADVANSTQLRSGAPVRIAGVDVGKVTEVARGPGTSALITMVIGSNGLPIHADATLTIRPRLFLEGSFYLQLDPGSPGAPKISSGFTVPERNTTTPVQFFTVVSTLNLTTRQAITTALHTFAVGLSGGGAQGLSTLTRELAPTLRDSAIVAQAAQGRTPDDVSHLIAGSARVARALAAHDAALGDLITSENRVAGALAAEDSALSASIPAFDGTLRAAPPALDAIRGSLPALERFAVDVQPALRAAPPVLRQTVPTLVQLRRLTEPNALPLLIGVLHPVVQVLPTLEGELETLLPKVTPVSQCVTSQVLPVLNTTLNDGALSTGQPVWKDTAHAFANAAGESSSFDANGYWLRYLGVGQIGVSTGSIPGLGALLGSAPGPVVGARPAWPGSGKGPAFQPGTACAAQPAPNLAASSGSSGLSTTGTVRASSLSASALRSLVLHPQLRGRHVVKVSG